MLDHVFCYFHEACSLKDERVNLCEDLAHRPQGNQSSLQSEISGNDLFHIHC